MRKIPPLLIVQVQLLVVQRGERSPLSGLLRSSPSASQTPYLFLVFQLLDPI